MTVKIREETSDDANAVHAIHAAAFGDDLVPRLVTQLRQRPATFAPRGYVATVDGEAAGHVMLTASWLDAPKKLVDVLVLSPLGVLPQHQRRGIGTLLVARAIEEADRAGAPLLFLEGDPAYYRERGFHEATPLGFRKPSLRIPDAAFQVVKLSTYEPWMTGTLVYAEPFWALDCVGLREED
ncbi:putative acetyltransferase [Asanoa ferruginea]|uniref:Putative acetyltransferase n=1 Tax=Asanoa ferruginea TaxID=53367 RepID=A0A3D9ZJ62_9ACTN|nr:N-acetyltransferase [Asanoa ferruginea]REF96512.1 putative acetyltransferase [Asanoa ferruginea]GIF53218.1 N-acetyltransferase [Asanoa ferruginea]